MSKAEILQRTEGKFYKSEAESSVPLFLSATEPWSDAEMHHPLMEQQPEAGSLHLVLWNESHPPQASAPKSQPHDLRT